MRLFLTDFTPLTPLATSTARLTACGEFTKPLNWTTPLNVSTLICNTFRAGSPRIAALTFAVTVESSKYSPVLSWVRLAAQPAITAITSRTKRDRTIGLAVFMGHPSSPGWLLQNHVCRDRRYLVALFPNPIGLLDPTLREAKRPTFPWSPECIVRLGAGGAHFHVRGPRSLVPLLDIERDGLPLRERIERLPLESRPVKEEFDAIVSLDEPKASLPDQPLDRARCHRFCSSPDVRPGFVECHTTDPRR